MARTPALLALAATLACGSTLAAEPAKPAQQTRMQGCNAQAKEKSLKGDDRKAFMSECLKKKA